MNTLFLSSTFNDMQKERDAFHKMIVPRMNDFLKKYGETMQLCDLRWGVDTDGMGEEESTKKILQVCFQSIRSTIPYFVVMLGGRYGWIPDEKQASSITEYNLSYHQQSVTEMEIEYQQILSTEYAAHALYFFREDLPKEQVSEENRLIYFSANEKEEKKLLALKEKIRRENPGRVFEYAVNWNGENQDYQIDEFVQLVYAKLRKLFEENFKELPILSKEEEVLNESAAFLLKEKNLRCGNGELLERCMKDIKRQIRGEENYGNEQLNAMLLKKERSDKDFYDPFYGFLYDKSGMAASWLGEIYGRILQLDSKLLPIPFAAGINANAQTGRQLLECIITAMEREILIRSEIRWRDKEDRMRHVQELVKFVPNPKYEADDLMQRRRYMETLKRYARKKALFIPFLIISNMEKMTDNASKSFLFMIEGGNLNFLIGMQEEWMKESFHARTITNQYRFEYRLKELRLADKQEYVREYFRSRSQTLAFEVEKKLLSLPASDHVGWMFQACEELGEMNEQDFARVRNYGDGPQAIARVMLEKVEKLEADQNALAVRRMLEYGKEINESLAKYIYGMLAQTTYGISQKMLEELSADAGVVWNGLDYELLIQKFPENIQIYRNGLLRFSENGEAELIREALDADGKLTVLYGKAMNAIDKSSPEYFTECLCNAIKNQNTKKIWEIAADIGECCKEEQEIIGLFFMGLMELDYLWAVKDTVMKIPEKSIHWVVSDLKKLIILEKRRNEWYEFYEALSERGECPLEEKFRCLNFMWTTCDKRGEHEKAKEIFLKSYDLIDRIREISLPEAVEAVSDYGYYSSFYRKEETDHYLQIASQWAEGLEKSLETAEVRIRLYRNLAVAAEKKEAPQTANAWYQEALEVYDTHAQEMCTAVMKDKRNFFYRLKAAYQEECVYLSDYYSRFLERNQKNVPAEEEVPCFIFDSTGDEKIEGFYTDNVKFIIKEKANYRTRQESILDIPERWLKNFISLKILNTGCRIWQI